MPLAMSDRSLPTAISRFPTRAGCGHDCFRGDAFASTTHKESSGFPRLMDDRNEGVLLLVGRPLDLSIA